MCAFHYIQTTEGKNAAHAEIREVLILLINLDVTIEMIEYNIMCVRICPMQKNKCFLFSCFITGEEARKGYFFEETGL